MFLTNSTAIVPSLTMNIIDLEYPVEEEKNTINFEGDGVVFPDRFCMVVCLEDTVGSIIDRFVHETTRENFPSEAVQQDKIFLGFEYDVVESPVFYKRDIMVEKIVKLSRNCKVFYCLVSYQD